MTLLSVYAERVQTDTLHDNDAPFVYPETEFLTEKLCDNDTPLPYKL